MPRSLLTQLTQLEASLTYNDAIGSVHTSGVAEAQVDLEGDLNVVRTMMKDVLGETNWYDAGNMSLGTISRKFFIYRDHEAGMDNVSLNPVAESFTTVTAQSGAESLGNISASYNNQVAMSFQVSSATNCDALALYLKKYLTPGTITVRVETDNSGAPSGTLVHANATTTIAEGSVSGTASWVRAVFATKFALAATTTYWIVASLASDPGSNEYYELSGAASSGYANGLYRYHPDGGAWTDGTTIVDAAFRIYNGQDSTAWDTVIKTITDHNAGQGDSATKGVIVNATLQHKLYVRDSSTHDPISDGNNNVVYGRIAYTGGNYVLTWYSNVSGTETPYSFTTTQNVDLAYVAVSQDYKNLPWSQFLDIDFHDVAGITGDISDNNVTVTGMSFLLTGLTTQHQVNLKVDKLGSTASGEGASGVAIYDNASYYTGTQAEAALQELATQIGGATSTTYNFAEENVLADNDAVYAALNKLDLKWGDLASTTVSEGASLVGINDAGGYTSETTVEGALQEIYSLIEGVSVVKVCETTVAPITSGTNHTLPGSMTYTMGSGANLDVYYGGQLLLEGASNDYQEVSTTQIKFNFTVPTGKNLCYMARK